MRHPPFALAASMISSYDPRRHSSYRSRILRSVFLGRQTAILRARIPAPTPHKLPLNLQALRVVTGHKESPAFPLFRQLAAILSHTMSSPTSPLIEDLPGDRDSLPSTSSSYRNPIEAYLAGTLNEPDYIRLLRLKEEARRWVQFWYFLYTDIYLYARDGRTKLSSLTMRRSDANCHTMNGDRLSIPKTTYFPQRALKL